MNVAIADGMTIKLIENDWERVIAKFADKECSWRLHAVHRKEETCYQNREYFGTHTCNVQFQVSNLKSTWLMMKYMDMFQSDPKKSMKGFRADVIKKFRVDVTKYQTYRTKKASMKLSVHRTTLAPYVALMVRTLLIFSSIGSIVIFLLEGLKRGVLLYMLYSSPYETFIIESSFVKDLLSR